MSPKEVRKHTLLLLCHSTKTRLRRRRRGLLMLESEELFPVIVEPNEDGSYTVSLLKAFNSDINSYVETRVGDGHPLYPRLVSAVTAINASGHEENIPGLGQRTGAIFTVETNKSEYDVFLNS